MLTKCITILAVCAQVYGSSCNYGANPVVLAPEVKQLPVAVATSQPTTINRNLVGQKKYPVALENCGPTPDQKIQVFTSRYTAPAQEKPIVRLPARIPGPKVVSHTCTCYKTIVRPRVHQQLITVPVYHRYIQTTHKPVVENIHYEATPVNCPTGPLAGKAQFVEVDADSTAKLPVVPQSVEVPSLPVVDVPRVPFVEAPRVPFVDVPSSPVVEVPSVPVGEVPSASVVEVPSAPVEFPRAPIVEIPRVEFPRFPVVESKQCPFRF